VKRTRLWIHVALPLVIGGLVYVLFRKKELILFDWLSFLQLDALVRAARDAVAPIRSAVPSWILFNLPDALWGWALGGFMGCVWRDGNARARAAWVGAGAAMVAAFELLQAPGVVPGTFDWVDLLVSCVAYASGVAVSTRDEKRGRRDETVHEAPDLPDGAGAVCPVRHR
jgi:hypothetical protein